MSGVQVPLSGPRAHSLLGIDEVYNEHLRRITRKIKFDQPTIYITVIVRVPGKT